MKPKLDRNQSLAISILSICLLASTTLLAAPANAQNSNRENWLRMIHILHLRLPENQPPPADDPNRPAGTFQKKGSGNWTDSAGNFYVRSAWGTWNNYDESKANPYSSLPDPLTLDNGRKITNPKTWWDKKRPEIARQFSEEIYGKIPANVPKVKWQVISRHDTTIDNIAAYVKHVEGIVNNSSDPSISVNIKLVLVTPKNAVRAVPVVVHLGYIFPKGFKFPSPPPGAHKSKEPSWKVQLLQKGWGFAVYYPPNGPT